VFLIKYTGADGSVCKAVAKFMNRYDREVHEYCAKNGFAPRLLTYEELPASWSFVFIMEYVQMDLISRIGLH